MSTKLSTLAEKRAFAAGARAAARAYVEALDRLDYHVDESDMVTANAVDEVLESLQDAVDFVVVEAERVVVVADVGMSDV